MAGFSIEQRALVAELATQRRRLSVLASWLLEEGRRGDALAAAHIVDGLDRVIAGLAA